MILGQNYNEITDDSVNLALYYHLGRYVTTEVFVVMTEGFMGPNPA